MRKRDHNVLTNAASLLICGLLAGVVVAAAAFPAVAMSGLAAKAGAETFGALPKELTVSRAPQISYLLASDGKTPLATMYDENRRDVKFDDISENMRNAIIAAEDHHFYKHNGVDLNGVARAFVNNSAAGNDRQGASTLTMQYVRMGIAYSATHPADVLAATEDTSARKLREMNYALQIEKTLSKDQILESYLNLAAFGNGAYGVYAASQVYFNKPPKDLKIEEAALLAGLVKAPTSFDPTTKTGYQQAVPRRNYVIDHMVTIGAITKEQAEKAKAVKLVVKGKRAPNGCVAANKNAWGFFCDYFYRWWMSQATFGSTSYDRERLLKSGGYTIITTLDKQAQNGADKAVRAAKPVDSKEAAMIAVVEPGTGRVRALSVNRNFKLDNPDKPKNKPHSDPVQRDKGKRGNYPNTVNPLLTGGDGITGYQAGSVFKMYTIVAALEKGIPLSYTFNAPQQFKSEYIIDRGNPAACDGTHFYCPTNSGLKAGGVQNMWSAFSASINTYFVPLQQQVGAENVVDVAKRLGIQFRQSEDAKFANNKEAAHQWGAFTLGVSQVTPLELANSYATLAADGKYCEPIPVQEIRDLDGNKLDVANPRCEKRFSTEVARAAVDAARCPVGDNSSTSKCGGSRTAAQTKYIVDAPVAGKSGTTDSEKTAALVAMTKQYAVAGIMADPDWPQTNVKMKHNRPDGINPPVWNTLRDAMKGKKRINFDAPGQKISLGDQRSIPGVRCVSVEQAKSRISGAGFEPIVSSNRVTSDCPAGTAAGTSPSGRTIKGGIVTIQLSAGNGSSGRPGNGPSSGPPSSPGRPPDDRPGG
ncbi:Membrane carboxypeptidase (penicillin-binding protein) [Micromonospora phaseoli]|uniref:Membrane carboxypeptidase (Penicillin-binding protein) n=1 Tax=Micromonospora phaseoli TaxID=1144548 RepID=A0A1H7DDJ4_9ACTN|nr:transglycosylase domain-containing protein [Micromonospora phaseoli]PZV90526.1 membrane peptidoglycan carboxypeptidase [Micromonospora phaseoli]GIJ78083.1 penicillin-binding protein [Micromonospora phaseoli]SEJ99871.1 Membrane carboxypeptidase (penicillin-binding protein) [Micromonospora phaseoli]